MQTRLVSSFGKLVPRKILVATCLMAMAGGALAASSTLAESLLAKLAKTPPVSTPFIQVAYRGVLARPLIVSGTLKWMGGDQMERDVDDPFTETAKIGNGEITVQRGHGRVHKMPLSRAPQVGAMLTGFRALLDGDVAALNKDFTLSAQGGDAQWAMTLAPRTEQLTQQLTSIVVDGRDSEPRCFTVTNPNGDTSITLVGAMAKAGLRSATPQQSALAARCRNDQ